MKKRFLALLCLLLLPLAIAAATSTPARAQEPSDADLGESATAVRALRDVRDKTLIFVFDVSGSMRAPVPGGRDAETTGETQLQRAREATISLIRNAAAPGDRLVLLTFGAGYRTVFDTKLQAEGDKDALIEQVPTEVENGAGTNIRKPHHDALKILDASLPDPGAVILLTDSFNDQPKADDPAYPSYLRYYTPGGRLTVYPDTPENRDYERLLRKLQSSRKVRMFGIGVQIDRTGRPVERLPQAAPTLPDEPTPQPTTVTTTPTGKQTEIPWLWIAIGVGVIGLAALLLLPTLKPAPLRITGGPSGPKDFSLKSGQSVRLGGDGANFAHDAYPLPGVAAAPAVVKGGRGGQFVLSAGGGTGNGTGAAKVYHNGVPLEKESPLGYGDEVRVSVADPSGLAKEFRLKFEDPKKSF